MLIGGHAWSLFLIAGSFASFVLFFHFETGAKEDRRGDVGSSEEEELQWNFESVTRNGRVCGRFTVSLVETNVGHTLEETHENVKNLKQA